MTPPKQIPPELKDRFTLNGLVPVIDDYWDNSDKEFFDSLIPNYTVENIDNFRQRIERREENYYFSTDTWLYAALDAYPVKDLDVVVFGSTQPWYEAMALTFGAKSVTCVEYSDRDVTYPDLTYVKPGTTDQLFDAAFSISSFEHDGLGRYGDPINPEGDLDTMLKIKSIIKPNGLLYLSIPIGTDLLFWNSRRHYGKIRFPMLIKDWKLLGSVGMHSQSFEAMHRGEYQPVFVLENV